MMQEVVKNPGRPAWYVPHTDMRTDAYMLLASLLNAEPSEELLAIISNLHWDGALPGKLQQSLAALSHAGATCDPESINREFRQLFVGLGSGELVPYGSWYLEKLIQSAPLAAIRTDLNRLGIVRRSETFESEDHAGALCEIMALLSNPEDGAAEQEQAAFFRQHIAPWMPDFFQDLQKADTAEFYRAVGAFGQCFLSSEQEYLQLNERS